MWSSPGPSCVMSSDVPAASGSSPAPARPRICSVWSTARFIARPPSPLSPRAHLLGLVDRALHRKADVGHLLAHARRGLGDPHLGLRGVVLRLDDLLLRAEGLDLRAQPLLGLRELGLLVLELGDLRVERLQ